MNLQSKSAGMGLHLCIKLADLGVCCGWFLVVRNENDNVNIKWLMVIVSNILIFKCGS